MRFALAFVKRRTVRATAKRRLVSEAVIRRATEAEGELRVESLSRVEFEFSTSAASKGVLDRMWDFAVKTAKRWLPFLRD